MNLSNHSFSIRTACGRLAVAIRAAAFALLLGVALPLAAQTAPSKSIQTLLVYYGGGPVLGASDASRLAKYDLIDVDRFRYNQIGSNTWSSIKALNPNAQIYLYEMGGEAPSHLDSTEQLYLNGLGRHNVSRGNSMGSLNGNHPELFLLDSSGSRIYNTAYSNPGANQFWYLMDFGSPAYQSYWAESVRADIANQPWAADGVHADNCIALNTYSSVAAKYPTNAAWSSAMNAFASGVTAGLHGFGQRLWCNRGETRSVDGSAAWRALDASPNAPDVVAEEGAFAVWWGPWAVQFYQESEWKRQVDTLSAIGNSKIAIYSHTQLLAGQFGTDNWGQSVGFWQTLWYSLGSYLLSKNDVLGNAYFMFHGGDNDYNKIEWYDEYDKIDLGKALGSYAVTTIGGVNIYSREFEKGYVYVNPTVNVASVALPQASRQLTHDNLLSVLSSIPIVNSITLNGHNAAILLKSTPTPSDTTPPSVPTGLTAVAVSSAQINLSWAASTDNVGVTGYRVYRAGTLLVTLGAVTTYQNTSLTPSTGYSYTVQALDAAGNASAQSAVVSVSTLAVAPVSVTTPAAPDTGPRSAGGGVHCFIATAAYGSPMAPDVRYLRAFRDQYLLTNKFGRWFVEQYYRLSPPLADQLRAHNGWRAVVRLTLSPLVALSKWLASDETFAKQTADGF